MLNEKLISFAFTDSDSMFNNTDCAVSSSALLCFFYSNLMNLSEWLVGMMFLFILFLFFINCLFIPYKTEFRSWIVAFNYSLHGKHFNRFHHFDNSFKIVWRKYCFWIFFWWNWFSCINGHMKNILQHFTDWVSLVHWTFTFRVNDNIYSFANRLNLFISLLWMITFWSSIRFVSDNIA